MCIRDSHGPGAYEELLAMEGQIRKERQQTVYKQQQLRRQIVEGITWFIVIAIIGGFVVGVAGIWMKKANAYEYKPRDYTKKQKIHQGKIKKKLYDLQTQEESKIKIRHDGLYLYRK